MRSFTQPWNLRRILGSQSVGCASSPSWPEAGITTRIIPAQSSRWTFRRPSNADLPTCRPADLPTCRPADLPTCRFWSLVTTGAPLAHSLQATAQAFPGTPHALVSSLQAPATVQRPVPVLALGTIRHPSSPPLLLEIARIQAPCLGKHQSSSMPIFQLLGFASSFILKASFPLTARNQEYFTRR